MIIREITESEKEQYNSVVGHLSQSYEWGQFKEQTENVLKVVRLGAFENDTLVNGFQISFHRTPLSSFAVGYLPRSKFPNSEEMEAIKSLGHKNNAIFIKIEPNGFEENGEQRVENSEQTLILTKPTLPKYSFLVDLTPSVENILGNMSEKTRYNIRLAEKHGVKIERRTDKEAVKIFFDLVTQTEKRQGFLQINHTLSYYEKIWDIFSSLGQIFILVASYEGQPLSAIFLLRFKDTLYYPYGGWSSKHRELMPNNLIHFEAMKLGKELGCRTYDMWGAYKEKDDSNDPWYGVYRFKQGFGGKFVTYMGPYDLVVNPPLYNISNAAYGVLRKLTSLVRK